MAGKRSTGLQPLLRAIAFASRAHMHQRRFDGVTPYSSHVFRVLFICRDVFGIQDRLVLTAAALHDTLEDTTTDFDDLTAEFGADVASWVAALSKDKRLPHADREKAYVEQLAKAPWQVQVCKLADIYDNLMDAAGNPAVKREKSMRNARRYLRGMKPSLTQPAQAPWRSVSRLLIALGGGRRNRGTA